MTAQGWVTVRDALTIGDWHDNKEGTSHTRAADRLRRRPPPGADDRVRAGPGADGDGLRADARLRAQPGALEPRSRRSAATRSTPPTATTTFRLFSDMRMGIEGNRARARHTHGRGREALLRDVLDGGARRPAHRRAGRRRTCERTGHFWRTWLSDGTYPDHPWRYYLQRSALVLKGLTYMPTGATGRRADHVAARDARAASRNWDYRYCWMRDATFALWGLHALGLDWEADDFMQYVADLERNEDGSLQIMYGDRRGQGPGGVDARPPARLREREPGAHRQRRLQPAPERRLRRRARLGLPARQAARPHSRAPVAGAVRPGRGRPAGMARARPGDLGGPRRAPALRLLQAHVLGRAGPRRAARRDARGHRARRELAGGRRGDPPGHPRRTASPSAGCSASTTTPTRWTPPTC